MLGERLLLLGMMFYMAAAIQLKNHTMKYVFLITLFFSTSYLLGQCKTT